MEEMLVALEWPLSAQETMGELSKQLDNVIEENKETTRAAKDIITEVERALK